MRVVIVEDQAFIREFLRKICQDLGMDVVAEASDGQDALAAVFRLRPELLLLDLGLARTDGFQVIEALKHDAPEIRVLVVSAHCEPYTVYRLEKLGVAGYVDKDSSTVSALRCAVNAISAGSTYFSEKFRRQRLARLRDQQSFDKILSRREQEILRLIGLPMSDEEIAEMLGVAAATVEKHRFNIMRKLGVHSTACLVRSAHEMGFTLPTGGSSLS